MEQKRRHYRTNPDPQVDLQVTLLDPNGQPHVADVVDASGSGIRLALPASFRPPALGTPVQLQLGSALLPAPVDVASVVVQSETTDDAQHLGLQFLDWLGLSAALPPALAAVFNLRAEERFELDPAKPVPVTVRGIEITFEISGVLRDVSRGGLSFYAAPVAECALSLTDRVVLDFTLPELDRQFKFVGRIRHRDLSGESVRYGVCFEAYHATNSGDQQQAVADYIDERRQVALGGLTAG